MGVMYLWMGAAIRFKGRYKLINNYDADAAAGKADEGYAKRVGTMMLAWGVPCAAAGAAAVVAPKSLAMAGLLLFCVLGSMASFYGYRRRRWR